MFALLGSRKTGDMNNTAKTTKTWFRRDEPDEASHREFGRFGARDRSSARSRLARFATASLAGLVGIGAASFGAVSAQANAIADSSASAAASSMSGPLSASAVGNSSADPTTSRPSSDQTAASKYAASLKRGKSRVAERRDLKAIIQELVDAGYPGALAAKTDKDGNAVGVTAGKGNLATGEAPPLDGEVRIGSNTKTFVAVVIMKMVEEGKVKLDEPVETYLPGLIKGQGVDGKKITVRQLLQHTSGLPEYIDESAVDYFGTRNDYVSPRDLLDTALARPAQFAPGAKFTYTNTNYIVLGLLAERVGKRPIAEQIEAKIVKPLGLKHTYMPGPGEKTLRGKHPRGYHTRDNKPGKLEDITDLNPSMAWTAGAMVSTPSELNKFAQSIHDGTLLRQKSIAEMKKGVSAPEIGGEYGLGIYSQKLSCGVAWGHNGGIPGYATSVLVGPNGNAGMIATNAEPSVLNIDLSHKNGRSPLDRAICGG